MSDEDIYSSVPEEAIDDSYLMKRFDVLDFLKATPETYHKAKAIAAYCGFPIRGTQVEVRKAITYLIEIDNQPIVSNAYGFAYTTNPDRLRFYADKLEERMQGLARRVSKIRLLAEEVSNNG